MRAPWHSKLPPTHDAALLLPLMRTLWRSKLPAMERLDAALGQVLRPPPSGALAAYFLVSPRKPLPYFGEGK